MKASSIANTWTNPGSGDRQHDAAYDANFVWRGNVTETWSRSAPEDRTLSYDLGGNVIGTTGAGPNVATTLGLSTNYLLPATVTPNSLLRLRLRRPRPDESGDLSAVASALTGVGGHWP
jgi:hypothetical protein